MPLTDKDREAIRATQAAPRQESEFNSQSYHNTAFRQGIISQTMGVHPTQVKEFNEFLDRQKITESRYQSDGSLYIASRADRTKISRLLNRVDVDGSYGDNTEFRKR